jgi:hypothetical protein
MFYGVHHKRAAVRGFLYHHMMLVFPLLPGHIDGARQGTADSEVVLLCSEAVVTVVTGTLVLDTVLTDRLILYNGAH